MPTRTSSSCLACNPSHPRISRLIRPRNSLCFAAAPAGGRRLDTTRWGGVRSTRKPKT
jgi:hypothetical protein